MLINIGRESWIDGYIDILFNVRGKMLTWIRKLIK